MYNSIRVECEGTYTHFSLSTHPLYSTVQPGFGKISKFGSTEFERVEVSIGTNLNMVKTDYDGAYVAYFLVDSNSMHTMCFFHP